MRSTLPSTPVRVALLGNVDAGKSTLAGVLTTGERDDGRGSARSKVRSLSLSVRAFPPFDGHGLR